MPTSQFTASTPANRPLRAREATWIHVSIWVAAGLVGIIAVFYASLIGAAQAYYLSLFHEHPLITSACTPLLFVVATGLVVRLAPPAKGSGIPQVLEAIEDNKWESKLVSLRTAFVKVLSSTVGILAGASIGREGPTVQIASSGFAWVGRRARRYFPSIDLNTFLVAGAASGVAAAFNTPLAGITFAIEEIAEGNFGNFRQPIMLAVIIAGITAQAIQGDYLYFGHPSIANSKFIVIPEGLLIGAIGGILGGAFARALAFPTLFKLPRVWWRRALLCGIVCSVIGFVTNGDTAGSGYEPTRAVLSARNLDQFNMTFPISKWITTVLSYLSGMAGGIFSPCLSIGAGIGLGVAKIANFVNFKACALIGMVAFFSSAVQAPLTAVIIVTEMTDEHILILPFMIAAFLAQGIGKIFMPVPLYRYLATRHNSGTPIA